jgi:hypothetical protein
VSTRDNVGRVSVTLGARKARHLDVGEVIVFGVISRPSLDVVTGVGAAVEEGRHDIAVLFFWLC